MLQVITTVTDLCLQPDRYSVFGADTNITIITSFAVIPQMWL